LLGDHDINFYLARKPPEFWRAVAIAGVTLAAMAAVIVRQFAAWLLGLPMVLFEGRGGKAALRASGEATTGMRGTLGFFLVAWLLGVRLLAALAAFVVSWIGGAAVQALRETSWIVVTLGAVLLASGLANLVVSVFANSIFPLVVVRLYRSLAGPGRLAPPLAPRGSLGSKPVIGLPDVATLAGAAVVFLAIVSGAGYVAEQIDEEEPPAIIAHRGASGAAPENTLAAFERAIADGADWIELDVQENADGDVVVHHDSDFMKQAGVPLKVWDATAEELSDVDVGSWFAPEFSQERVPTLHDALGLARGKVGVFIELK
jgi:glycerophosphoryl diester phosphodiesterase